MSKLIKGTHTEDHTPCYIFVAGPWYCILGSNQINRAIKAKPLVNGVHLDDIKIDDNITASSPINTLNELEKAIADNI